jgi:mannitol/fructose-specific phosphotransferase system IIA component
MINAIEIREGSIYVLVMGIHKQSNDQLAVMKRIRDRYVYKNVRAHN